MKKHVIIMHQLKSFWRNPNKEDDKGEESDDEGKPKNEGDQKKDEKPNESKDKPQEKKQPPKDGQLSPQQVQSLLEAMNNQEKKVQDKVNAKKVKGFLLEAKKIGDYDSTFDFTIITLFDLFSECKHTITNQF